MDQPEKAITNVATHVEREEVPWMMDVNDERRISAWIMRGFTLDQRRREVEDTMEFCKQHGIKTQWFCTKCKHHNLNCPPVCERCQEPMPKYDYIIRGFDELVE